MKAKQIKNRILKMKREGGYSMLEIGLALIVVAVLSVGVVTYFGQNNATAQANQLTQDLSAMVGKVKASWQGQYASVTNAKLNTGGFLTGYPSMTNAAGTVTLGLGGGSLTVASGTVTTAGDSVSYVMTQIPDSACLPLVSALAKTATKLSIGATVVKATGGAVDPSKITCSGDANTITMLVQ